MESVKIFIYKLLATNLYTFICITGCIKQGVSKKCPEYEIASKLNNCKITDHRHQPTANIVH